MAIDAVSVGSHLRTIVVVGDPSQNSQMLGVTALGDAKSLGSLYAAVVGAVPWLYNNATGLFDQQRAAAGTTGVPVVNTEGTKTTYSCAVVGFTPAANATDFWQITGSASKTIRVLRIAVSGLATAAASADLLLVKRSTASTGTPTAQTVAPHDSNDAAATAAVNTFAANPSGLGTLVGTVRAQKLNLGAAGAAGQVVWDFATRNAKGQVLRGAAQQLALNWNGATVPSGTSLDIEVEFTEE